MKHEKHEHKKWGKNKQIEVNLQKLRSLIPNQFNVEEWNQKKNINFKNLPK